VSEDQPSIAVVFKDCGIDPRELYGYKKPKVTIWHWIKYYVYNLWRKPRVIRKQKQLKEISEKIKSSLRKELFPQLLCTPWCQNCREAHAALYQQIFLSQIEKVLRCMSCPQHETYFNEFLTDHGYLFRESEKIAMWINGFSE
jgi:hypothetical protein